MPYILKIYFAGTGDCAIDVKKDLQKRDAELLDASQESNIIRIYFSGCQNKAIGGRSMFLGYLSPDLNVVTEKLRLCFNKNNGVFFNAKHLKKVFSDSVLFDDFPFSQNSPLTNLSNIEINHIHLYGYSRGAVTTFLVGKALNEFGINIEIFAEEPIPGESKAGFKKSLEKRSLCHQAYHLENCQHITKATIMLGDHSHIEETNVLYRQMSPIFHRKTQAGIYLISKNKHSFFGLFDDTQFLHYLLPEKINVTNFYFNYLLSLHLNELCDFLALQPSSIDTASPNDLSEPCSDNDLDTLSVNEMFYGNTIRVRLLSEPIFLPRALKRSFHFGVLGRVQCAPSIKQWFHIKYQAFYLNSSLFRLKQYQALCALCINTWDKPQNNFSSLIQRICDENGDLSENIALRDFIIEVNRTFNYFKQQSTHLTNIMDSCIHSVWQSIESSIIFGTDKHWPLVLSCLNEILKVNKKAIGKACFTALLNSFKELIKTSPLFNSTLVKYLKALDDEGMTEDLNKARNHAYDDEPTTAFELIRNIFFSTSSRREILFDSYKNSLDLFNLSLENVVDLSVLLNHKQATELLKLPIIKGLFNDAGSLEVISNVIDKIPETLCSFIDRDISCQLIERHNLVSVT